MYDRAYVMCAPMCSPHSFSLLTEWRKHRREPLMEGNPRKVATRCPHSHTPQAAHTMQTHIGSLTPVPTWVFEWAILKFYISTLLWPKSNKKEQHLLVWPAAPLPTHGGLDGSIRNREMVRSWGSGRKEERQRAYIILRVESLLGMTLRWSFA